RRRSSSARSCCARRVSGAWPRISRACACWMRSSTTRRQRTRNGSARRPSAARCRSASSTGTSASTAPSPYGPMVSTVRSASCSSGRAGSSGGRSTVWPDVPTGSGRPTWPARETEPHGGGARSIDHDVAPQTLRLFLAHVLADLLHELLARLPGAVFLELAHHARPGTGDAEDVGIGGAVQPHGNERVLGQPGCPVGPHVLADLPVELRIGLPRPILVELADHALARTGHE